MSTRVKTVDPALAARAELERKRLIAQADLGARRDLDPTGIIARKVCARILRLAPRLRLEPEGT